jgi:hypothetical protein
VAPFIPVAQALKITLRRLIEDRANRGDRRLKEKKGYLQLYLQDTLLQDGDTEEGVTGISSLKSLMETRELISAAAINTHCQRPQQPRPPPHSPPENEIHL